MSTGKNTKGYETPNHPYQGERIAEESDLLSRYGLKNKEEFWRAQSELRSMRREARVACSARPRVTSTSLRRPAQSSSHGSAGSVSSATTTISPRSSHWT